MKKNLIKVSLAKLAIENIYRKHDEIACCEVCCHKRTLFCKHCQWRESNIKELEESKVKVKFGK